MQAEAGCSHDDAGSIGIRNRARLNGTTRATTFTRSFACMPSISFTSNSLTSKQAFVRDAKKEMTKKVCAATIQNNTQLVFLMRSRRDPRPRAT